MNCIVTSHTSVKSFREIRHALCWSLSTREFYYKNKLFLFPHECIRSLSRYCLVLCVLDQVEVNFRHDFPILNENLINNGTAEFDTRLFSIMTIHRKFISADVNSNQRQVSAWFIALRCLFVHGLESRKRLKVRYRVIGVLHYGSSHYECEQIITTSSSS